MSNTVELLPGIWNLTPSEDSAAFLVLGNTQALLIDTSFGRVSLPPLIEGITNLPVTLVNTHGHGDHVGGNKEFPKFYLHPFDIPIMNGNNSNAKSVEEGDSFDLGNKSLKVIHIPGHSPGSIALLCMEDRVIFTGDMLANRPIYFVPNESDGEQYIQSMEKLEKLSPLFDTVICSHGQSLMSPKIIGQYKAAMRAFLNNKLPYSVDTHIGTGGKRDIRIYHSENGLGFIYPLN